MLVIRFARGGTNNRPYFHIVVAEKRGCRDGKYLERLGFYLPKETEPSKKLNVNRDALNAWVKKGAKPSETLQRLLRVAQ